MYKSSREGLAHLHLHFIEVFPLQAEGLVGDLLPPQATPAKIPPDPPGSSLMPPQKQGQHRALGVHLGAAFYCFFSHLLVEPLSPLGGIFASLMTHPSSLWSLWHQLSALQVQRQAFGLTKSISLSKSSSCRAAVSALVFKASFAKLKAEDWSLCSGFPLESRKQRKPTKPESGGNGHEQAACGESLQHLTLTALSSQAAFP